MRGFFAALKMTSQELCLAKMPSAFSFKAFCPGRGLEIGRLLTVKTCDFSVGWSFGETQLLFAFIVWSTFKTTRFSLSELFSECVRLFAQPEPLNGFAEV